MLRRGEGCQQRGRWEVVLPLGPTGAAADADREHPAQPEGRAGIRSTTRSAGSGRGTARSCARPATTGRTTSPSATTTPTAAWTPRERLLVAIGAPTVADEVKAIRLGLRRLTADKDDKKVAQVRGGHAGVGGAAARGARSLRPTTTSRPGNFQAAEFAADLYKVAATEDAGKDYAEPVQFFARTYLTEGLRDLIDRAVRRLAGDENASPVINLQTNFGGGKTHSMLALWHLASGTAARRLPAGRPGDALRDAVQRAGRRRAARGDRRQPHLAVGLDRRPTGRRSTRSGASSPGSSAAGRRSRWSRPRTPTAPRPGRRCTSCSAPTPRR